MKKEEESTDLPVEEILADIWQKANRAEALLTVVLRTQAEILSKTSNITVEQALENINEDIREEFEKMNDPEDDTDNAS